MRELVVFLVLAVGGALFRLDAGVHSWRNGGNGQYPGASAPVDWSDRENAKWSTALASTGNASPILVDGRVIICREPSNLIAANADTGEILWERENTYFDVLDLSGEKRDALTIDAEIVAELGFEIRKLGFEANRLRRSMRRAEGEKKAEISAQIDEKNSEIEAMELDKQLLVAGTPLESLPDRPPAHQTNGYSSYTPVSDGTRVFAAFGTGVVVCFSLDGERLWGKFVEHPDHDWGGSTSPLLIEDRLVVRFKDFVALDPETGDEVWRTPTDQQFGTPATFEVEGESFLFTSRAELVRVSDGSILHNGYIPAGSRGWAYFNTPAVHGDRIFAVRGDEGSDAFAYGFKIPDTVDALADDGVQELWKTEVERNRYYASPVVIDGLMVVVTRRFDITAIDVNSGDLVYARTLDDIDGDLYSGLIAAGGMTYLSSDKGTTVVLKPGRTYEEIGRFESEPFRSTPILYGNLMIVRSYGYLSAYDGG